ncbi:two-component response regulator ORR7-like [Cornus florida]|uniref:two-component response regulator ORR7-like n=1 Tax=Cornus florida TaxID=4283 RepID=UPI00289B0258|nr:two-component response regulator ORR7-like [Cornus florida]
MAVVEVDSGGSGGGGGGDNNDDVVVVEGGDSGGDGRCREWGVDDEIREDRQRLDAETRGVPYVLDGPPYPPPPIILSADRADVAVEEEDKDEDDDDNEATEDEMDISDSQAPPTRRPVLAAQPESFSQAEIRALQVRVAELQDGQTVLRQMVTAQQSILEELLHRTPSTPSISTDTPLPHMD